MESFDYSKIWDEIAENVEKGLSKRLGEIDYEKVIKQSLAHYHLSLDDIDWDSKSFQLALGKGLYDALNGVQKKVKTDLGDDWDISKYMTLNPQQLANKIGKAFTEMKQVLKEDGKEAAKEFQDTFFQAMTVGMSRNLKDRLKEEWYDAYDDLKNELKVGLGGKDTTEYKIGSDLDAKFTKQSQTYQEWSHEIQNQIDDYKETVEIAKNVVKTIRGALPKTAQESDVRELLDGLLESSGARGFKKVKENLQEVSGAADDVVDNVVEKFESRAADAEKAGEKVGESIIEGIKEGVQDTEINMTSNLDIGVEKAVEDIKELGETAKDESRSLETLTEKLEYLKTLKAESAFMETAEEKRMDMEEKAWDVGGNKPKSEADSQKKIQKYEELCDHIEKANNALDEFDNTYEKVIVTLKTGEKLEVFDASDLDGINLAKKYIKDIEFIPSLKDDMASLGSEVAQVSAESISSTEKIIDNLNKVQEEIVETTEKLEAAKEQMSFEGFHATDRKWTGDDFDFSKAKAAQMGAGMYFVDSSDKLDGFMNKAKGGEIKKAELNLEKCFILTQDYISSISDINDILGTTFDETSAAKDVMGTVRRYNKESKANSDNFRQAMLAKGYQGMYVGDNLANKKIADEFVVYDENLLKNLETISKETFKTMNDGVQENIENLQQDIQKTEELAKAQHELGKSQEFDDDIEAYMAEMDAKVASSLGTTVKETKGDVSELGEEFVQTAQKSETAISQMTEDLKETNKAFQLFKETGGMSISEMLDTGYFSRLEEVAEHLGEKYTNLLYGDNDDRMVWNETLLSAEYFKEILPYLDLTADQLDVIKTELYAIDKIKPGGQWEKTGSLREANKRIYAVSDITTGKRDVTAEELDEAQGLLRSMQEFGRSIDNLGNEFVEAGQQGNNVTNKIADNINGIKEDFEDLNNGEKRVISDIGLTYEQLVEKLRQENEEIKKGNKLFAERMVYLKDGIVVDSLMGQDDMVASQTNVKDYDKIIHTHPITSSFSANDIVSFWQDKFRFGAKNLSDVELFADGQKQVSLGFQNLTDFALEKFADFYYALHNAIGVVFGEEADFGRIKYDMAANIDIITAYQNKIASWFMETLGGTLEVNHPNSDIIDDSIAELINSIAVRIDNFSASFDVSAGVEEYRKRWREMIHQMFGEAAEGRSQNKVDLPENTEEKINMQDTLQSELEETKAKLKEAEESTDSYRNEVASLNLALQDVYEHTVDQNTYDEDIKEKVDAIEELRGKLKDVEDELTDEVNHNDYLDTELASAQEALEAEKKLSSQVASDLETQKEKTAELEKQNELLEQQRKEAQLDAEQWEGVATDRAMAQWNAEGETEKAQAELAAEKAKADVIEQENQALKEQANIQEQKIEAIERERAYYEEAANNGEREITNLEEQLKREQDHKSLLGKQAEELAEKNQELKETNKVLDETNQKLKEELELEREINSKKASSSSKVGKKEVDNVEKLAQAVRDVVDAVNEKTKAFKDEQTVVKEVVASEVGDIKELKGSVDDVKKTKQTKQQQKQQKEKDTEAEKIRKVLKYYEQLEKTEQRYQYLIAKRDISTKDLSVQEEMQLNKLEQQRALEQKRLETLKSITKEVRDAQDAYRLIAETEQQSATNATRNALIKSIQSKVKATQSKIDSGRFTQASTGEIQERLNRVTSANLNELETDQLKTYVQLLEDMNEQFVKAGNNTKLTNLLGEVNQTIADNSKLSKDLKAQFIDLGTQIEESLKTGSSQAEVQALTKRFLELKVEMVKTGQNGKSFFGMIKNDIVQASARVIATYMSFQDLVRYTRQAVSAVTELNTALTQLKIVSGASDSAIKSVSQDAYNLANKLGMSTTEVVSSITEWRRLGKSIEDSMTLAEQAARLSTGGIMDISSATTALTSSMQAFEMEADDVYKVVDQYIYLGNNYAITSESLATSLTKSMAALKVAGNSLEQIEALEVAGNAIMQDADAVSNALKVDYCLHMKKFMCYAG